MSDTLKRIRKLYDTSDIKPTLLQPIIGVSSSALSEWNKGKGSPSLDSIKKISTYFDVSMDWIVFGDQIDELCRHPFADKEWIAGHNKSGVISAPVTPAQIVKSKDDGLSASEKDIIAKLRVLDDVTRAKVMGYLDMAYSSMPVNDPSSKRITF